MQIHVVYTVDGHVVAVSMPDAVNGQDLVSAPHNGQSVLTLDLATVKHELDCSDDAQLGFAILDRCRVDPAAGRLLPRWRSPLHEV